jgi:serine/threonine protein kinase
MGCLQSKGTKQETFDYSTGSTTGVILESTKPYVPPTYSGKASTVTGTGNVSIITDSDAILIAANYCKDSPFQWQNEALVNIGSTPQKWHFLVRGKDTESSRMSFMVLTLSSLKDPPISLSNSTTSEVFGNLLCALSHPYLFPTEDVSYLRDKQLLVTVQRYVEKGSLRDLIYGKQNPKERALVKYRRENCRPLRPKVIRTFGRHILEALSALNAKGIVCDSLKASNVLLDNGIARISGLENTFLGCGLTEELGDMIVAYEMEVEGRVCALDVILFGLCLLPPLPLSSNLPRAPPSRDDLWPPLSPKPFPNRIPERVQRPVPLPRSLSRQRLHERYSSQYLSSL